MEILKVQNLCKTYGKGEAKVDALKNVSFSLNKGEFAAVVGESGSGKSTLLNCVGALDSPTSGHILVDGQDLFSMKEEQRTIFRRRNIGFIFQSFQLVSELNVEQNIMLGMKSLPMPKDQKTAECRRVIEKFYLGGLEKHSVRQLSGGQQQRVALARIMVSKPRILMLDEPTASLDPASTRRIEDLLLQLSERYAIILVSHGIAQARRLATRLLLFEDGHARGPFPPEELARIFPHEDAAGQA